MQAIAPDDSIGKVVDLLRKELGTALDRTTIASYLDAAIRDLRGSICVEALPEMACKLAGYRLTVAAVRIGHRIPLPTPRARRGEDQAGQPGSRATRGR